MTFLFLPHLEFKGGTREHESEKQGNGWEEKEMYFSLTWEGMADASLGDSFFQTNIWNTVVA